MGPRILIVDDHPSFRALVRRMLEEEGFDVIGEACDAAGALQTAEERRPDVVLLDIHLPDGDGYAVARALTGAYAGMAVILTSTHEPEDVEPLVSRSGARGFVAKHELSGDALGALMP